MKVAKNQSGVMELGGNMDMLGDLETRLAGAKKREQIEVGELTEKDFEFALPAGSTRTTRNQARLEPQSEKSSDDKK